MRVGGDIREPIKVRHVDPVYPPLALAARVEGAVTLQCVITTDGTVSEITIVSVILTVAVSFALR